MNTKFPLLHAGTSPSIPSNSIVTSPVSSTCDKFSCPSSNSKASNVNKSSPFTSTITACVEPITSKLSSEITFTSNPLASKSVRSSFNFSLLENSPSVAASSSSPSFSPAASSSSSASSSSPASCLVSSPSFPSSSFLSSPHATNPTANISTANNANNFLMIVSPYIFILIKTNDNITQNLTLIEHL